MKKMNKWTAATVTFILVLIVVTLVIAFAVDQEAPLVSQSYLEGLRSQLVTSIRNDLRDSTDDFMTELDEHHADIERQINEQVAAILNNASEIDLRDPDFLDYVVNRVVDAMASPTGTIGDYSLMRRVNVPANTTIVGPIGMEVVLRQGSAVAVGATNPAMVDLTSGDVLNDGAALQQNHLYLVTIPASGTPTNGFRSGPDGATVFIRGHYSVVN